MTIKNINNKNSEYKALGCFIFTGSAAIGAMKAGYNVDKILEVSDDMLNQNSYHFIKNFGDSTPVIAPSIWENDEYLAKLKNENYDMCFSNTPCSSLSQINRNASVDGDKNIHFYRVFNLIDKIEPKTFLIENAPTLIKLGYPILKDMVTKLNNKYNFSIIRDYAGNHNVCMKRARTLVIGWRKDYFNNNIPLINRKFETQPTTIDILNDLIDKDFNYLPNHNLVNNRTSIALEHLFKYSIKGKTINESIIHRWDELKDKITDNKSLNTLQKQKDKMDNGKRYWDKSPYGVKRDGVFPSMTSVTEILHPVLDRQLTIREYARIMGYPDDFIFYPEECKTPIIQCISQGVPVNFIKYITSEIKETINKNNKNIVDKNNDDILCFQHNIQNKYRTYSLEDLNNETCFEIKKNFKTIE